MIDKLLLFYKKMLFIFNETLKKQKIKFSDSNTLIFISDFNKLYYLRYNQRYLLEKLFDNTVLKIYKRVSSYSD